MRISDLRDTFTLMFCSHWVRIRALRAAIHQHVVSPLKTFIIMVLLKVLI